MRIPTMLSLDSDVVAELKSTASDIGVPFSALNELALKLVFRHGREKLEAWATQYRAAKPAKKDAARLTASVQKVLSILDDVPKTRAQVEAQTGQSPGIVWRALLRLEAVGLVKPSQRVPQGVFNPLVGFCAALKWTRVTSAEASGPATCPEPGRYG